MTKDCRSIAFLDGKIDTVWGGFEMTKHCRSVAFLDGKIDTV